MLGYFLNRTLLMLLGYAYPAFECFKAVEKNKVEIEELRFWCQYWILAAMVTVFEKVVDIFVSWLPMYGELKLVFFIYLWCKKTKGTKYVFDTVFRPIMAKHETEIDRKIMEMKARAWDFFVQYLRNSTQMGQATLIQIFHYLLAQSSKFSSNPPSKQEGDEQKREPETTTKGVNGKLSNLEVSEKKLKKGSKWATPSPPPTPTPTPATVKRMVESRSGALDQNNVATSPISEARSRLRQTKTNTAEK